VHVVLAADPDVRIEEEFGEERRPLVAIEIKGGTDRSNAHNRAGEAEKSHQKAKALGFRDRWTVIAKGGLDLSVLEAESPTTNSWFDTAHVLAREGEDWKELRTRIVGSVGIPG
jgi:XcyI restriction endonuclease